MVSSQAVPVREKLSYAMTSFGLSSVTGVVSAFTLYFFTDVALLAPATVTWMLFAVRVFDGAVDPFIGHYMDRRRTKYGKYKGYLIYWSLPFALFFVLLFLPAPFRSGAGKAAWYLTVNLAWSLCCSIVESANLPLLVVLTGDAKQRHQTNAAKILSSILATLAAHYAALELVKWFGGSNEAKGYALTAVLFAAVAFLCIQLPARALTERNVHDETPPNIFKAAFGLLRDPKILFMLLFYFAHQMGSSVKGQAAIYYMKYIVDKQELTSAFLIMSTLSSLAMQPVIILCSRKIPIKHLVVFGYLGAAAGIFIMGTAGTSVPMLFAGNFIYGLLVAFPANLLFVYTAELADKHKGSSSAMLHSLLGLSARFAAALAGSLISLTLTMGDYIPNISQSADSQSGIKFAFITITLILYLCAAGFSFISFRFQEKNSKKGAAFV